LQPSRCSSFSRAPSRHLSRAIVTPAGEHN
jgi:hypothetical protein